MISTLYLHKRLRYDPETGALIWRAKLGQDRETTRWNARHAGTSAGSINKLNGRLYIGLQGKLHAASRIIWQMMLDEVPSRFVDHIDGDTANNRWSNLRLATRSQNGANRKLSALSTTGLKGVAKCGKRRYQAYLRHEGKRRHLGVFDTPEEAHAAYMAAARAAQGEFARAG